MARIYQINTYFFITLVLLIHGCASNIPSPVENKNRIQKCPDVYTVKKGDTIFSLSLKCGFDYKQVALVNDIEKPYKISPGEIIRFDLLRNKDEKALTEPENSSIKTEGLSESNELKEATKTQEDFREPIKIDEPKATKEVYSQKAIKKTKEIVAENQKKLATKYIWPTEGKVIEQFNLQEGKKGISISGELGQEIKSIAKGKVIYAGEELKGFGKLIIIKHEDNILSVYGHNRELLVTEGQKVDAGEIISTMGNTGTDKVKLHFEIRKNGQSVDPTPYFKDVITS
jgi:lipoprotein NlpD